ncbi:Pcc1-domain-containing protein [Aulographum hederae CBS 113979]|uniref:Pcc1-domain-containing protein n=1 Tax=Aulographum hederae CBS 113979 TaxID=1176131 RepID=A0A6G1GKY9_9PEZI|nr:Pcc1-domain-containing protein [Aulographum hederae CBS 113979]
MPSPPTPEFPCKLTLRIPFPTSRLARAALLALQVDKELSPLVQRSFEIHDRENTILVVLYEATTNRMLRVSVNGFFESLGVVLGVMEELDVDVIERPTKEILVGVQGIVQEVETVGG